LCSARSIAFTRRSGKPGRTTDSGKCSSVEIEMISACALAPANGARPVSAW
jgi:hypothetical protein